MKFIIGTILLFQIGSTFSAPIKQYECQARCADIDFNLSRVYTISGPQYGYGQEKQTAWDNLLAKCPFPVKISLLTVDGSSEWSNGNSHTNCRHHTTCEHRSWRYNVGGLKYEISIIESYEDAKCKEVPYTTPKYSGNLPVLD